MKRKFSLSSVLSLVLVAILLTFLITYSAVNQELNRELEQMELDKIEYQKLSTVDSIVKEHYALPIDSTVQSEQSIAGYVYGLGDGYSRYLGAEAYAEYLDSKREVTHCDLGFEVCPDPETQAARVCYIASGSEAENSRLQLGDVLLSVGEVTFAEAGYSAVCDALEGAEGVSVGVQFLRGEESVTYTLTYQPRENEILFSSLLYGSAGYIRIRSFEETTASELKRVIDSFVANGADAILFDVRGLDSQGFDSAVSSVGVIAGRCDLARVISGGGSSETVAGEGESIPISCAVLTDENTCGAPELFAAALRDTAGAKVVGVKSRGCAALLTDIMLNDQSALLLATRMYLPPLSDSFHGAGVTPDLEQKSVGEFRFTVPEQDGVISEAYYLLKPHRRPALPEAQAPAADETPAEVQ